MGDIYVINADDTGLRRLTDGSRIALTRWYGELGLAIARQLVSPRRHDRRGK
jgi:hypothetical protein